MAKTKQTRQAKASRRRKLRWHPKYLGALVGGIVLLLLGAILWQQFANATFDDHLIRKLPKDSTEAGVARLSALDPSLAPPFANGLNVYPANVAAITSALNRAGVSQKDAQAALDDQFAWAKTPRGTIAVFTVTSEPKLRDISEKLKGQLDNPQPGKAGDLTVSSAVWHGTNIPVVTAVSGRELYVASNADLIAAAKNETAGFTTLTDFGAVSSRLPSARGGYLFFNAPAVQAKVPNTYSMVGAAWSPNKDSISLSLETAPVANVARVLPGNDGSLQPANDLFTASVGGTDASKFMGLLEDQRQDSDLPKVLSLQNAVSNLDRALGKDAVGEYLAPATGHWVYGIYPGTEGVEWGGLLEYPSGDVAGQKLNEFTALMQVKLTIPVRHEVITVLPDGTQSREVVAEGREPVQFVPFSVPGGEGKAVNLPNIGHVFFKNHGQYLLLASSADAIQRLETSLSRPKTTISQHGSLTIRINVGQAYRLTGDRDVLMDWILAARPSSGRLILTRDSTLTGALDFNRSSR